LTLKELWHRRILVALSFLLALAAAVLVVYHVSLSPFGITKKSATEAKGSISILVDSARSPLGDAQRDLAPLSGRAGVLASYMSGGDVIGQIAKANQIPPKQIEVVGPTPLPGEAPGVEEGPAVKLPYGIEIKQEGELPVLQIVTRAPTLRQAADLAAAAPTAIRRVVRHIQEVQDIPDRRRVEFRELGPAETSVVQDTLGKKVAVAVFVLVFGLLIAAILGLPRLIAAWRESDAEELPADLPPGEETPSGVVHLPGPPASQPADEPRQAARVRRQGDT
jgi:hypothetical protein